MAIMFVYAYHGLPWLFAASLAFNLLMLISIPYCGDHYAIDIAGGFAVALFAIAIARWLLPTRAETVPRG